MNLNLAKSYLLLITPVASLVGIAAPSLAATLGSSDATVNINNFSHNIIDVLAFSDTADDTLVNNGVVNTEFQAEAIFRTNPPSVNNSSFSRVDGTGSDYSSTVQTTATSVGYNFVVDKGDFSFDYDAGLNLSTSRDNPNEYANASGTITLSLYDTTNQNNWIKLDSLNISGNLTTGASDSISSSNSGSSFNPNITSINSNFGGDRETANASSQGSLSRTFENLTSLTLIADQTNDVSVSVPEPSSFLGILLCLIASGYHVAGKAFKSSVTQKP